MKQFTKAKSKIESEITEIANEVKRLQAVQENPNFFQKMLGSDKSAPKEITRLTAQAEALCQKLKQIEKVVASLETVDTPATLKLVEEERYTQSHTTYYGNTFHTKYIDFTFELRGNDIDGEEFTVETKQSEKNETLADYFETSAKVLSDPECVVRQVFTTDSGKRKLLTQTIVSINNKPANLVLVNRKFKFQKTA